MDNAGNKDAVGLSKYLSPAGAWAISVGTSIGWGSFVITGNSYLCVAGPAGSVLGLVIGAIVMVVIGRNYHFMMQVYPDSGGVYTYAKKTFGFDYGFLTAWFLILTYVSMFWANVTSLPIFARYFIGEMFCFGPEYTVFGYDIFAGEAILSVIAIIVAAIFCSFSKKLTEIAMVAMVSIFTIGILVCFLAAVFKVGGNTAVYDPAFLPDHNLIYQVVKIACISPWAFVGFENISNSVEEFSFSEKKTFSVFNVSIITTTVLYISVIILSITTFPDKYDNWLEYLSDLKNLDGLEGLPPFYAAYHYLGNAGVLILIFALLSLVITSLIGNTIALSRLLYALSKDKVISEKFSELNSAGIPEKAILLIAAVSVLIPFFGRVAVGWVVDVTTLGATIIYGCVSGAAFYIAKKERKNTEVVTGIIGAAAMIFFMGTLLLPNMFVAEGSLAPETYFLFATWGILGILVFRKVLHDDHKVRRFGRSGIVWVVLLLLILLTSQEWMKESASRAAERSVDHIVYHYGLNAKDRHTGKITDEFILKELKDLEDITTYGSVVMVGLFAVAVWIIMGNYSLMAKREIEREKELNVTRIKVYTDPLTGVKSKTAYSELEMLYNSCIKDDTMEEFAVVLCDVNGLKQINDTMGHKAGDKLICEACRVICEHFKHSPVFRIGGDEFVAVLRGHDYECRNEIMDEFNDRMTTNKKRSEVVIAAGISDYEPGKDRAFHDVFERADALMYIRKKELKE